MVVVAGLPAVILAVAGVLLAPKSPAAGVAADGTPLIAFQLRALLESAAMILQLVVFDQREAVFAVLVGGLLAGLAIVALRSRLRGRGPTLRPTDGYLAVVAVLLLAILFVPDATTLGAGGAGRVRHQPAVDVRDAGGDPVGRGPSVRVVGARRDDRGGRRGRGRARRHADRPGTRP